MQFIREIEIRHEVDVFIAGGGPSGVAAAVACARMGKSVYLAEACGAFGGTGTIGLVPAFMQFGDGEHFLSAGIGREIRDALSDCRDNSARNYPIQVERLKRTYDDMMTKAGVQFTFFTDLIAAELDTKGHVDHVVLSSKSGIYAVKAKIYIDCTGDGDLSVMAGADYEMGNEDHITMPATLCSLWANIDFSRVKGPDSRALENAFADGVFTNEDRHLPGMFVVDREHGIGGGNIGHCYAVDATDEHSLTKAMLWGRQYMLEFEKYYKEYLSGYENMVLCCTADILGVRESRRILGDYVLNVEDFKSRAVFDDEIGRYAYPVDIHAMSPDKKAYEKFDEEYMTLRYKKGESYGIPYRALTPKNLDNVLVAGRCISTDRQMQASVRVMPGCYITGQAAGIAAALAAEKGDVRSFHMQALQNALVKAGGYLPNA